MMAQYAVFLITQSSFISSFQINKAKICNISHLSFPHISRKVCFFFPVPNYIITSLPDIKDSTTKSSFLPSCQRCYRVQYFLFSSPPFFLASFHHQINHEVLQYSSILFRTFQPFNSFHPIPFSLPLSLIIFFFNE